MQHQRGFSIVELLVAVTVTLIVSSAIYGLLAAGGSAFRREPEMADRQQNIRAAMDMIARDVFGAGASMPTFAQAFSLNDPAGDCAALLNGCGPAGTMGPTAAAARTGDEEDTDVLQIVSTDEQCPYQSICSPGPLPSEPTGGIVVSQESVPRCLRVPSLVLLANDSLFTIQAATAAGGGGICSGGGPLNGNLTLGGPLFPVPTPAFPPGNNPQPPAPNSVYLYRARLVRYRVAPSSDPNDTGPALWRTESGLFNPDGSATPEPGSTGFNPAVSPWQLVARGIEDLQVEYRGGSGNPLVPGAWQNQPPASAPDNWTTLVCQVRISLSARVIQANLAGESSAGGGAPNAVRGQLSTVVTPRAAFHELQMGRQIQ